MERVLGALFVGLAGWAGVVDWRRRRHRRALLAAGGLTAAEMRSDQPAVDSSVIRDIGMPGGGGGGD